MRSVVKEFLSLSITELKGIPDHFDPWGGWYEFYGYDVEPGGHIRESFLIEIGQGDLGELALLPLVDRGCRSAKILRGPGFHFDEDQSILIPRNDVDLPERTLEISLQDLILQGLELDDGQLFAFLAEGKPLLSHRRGDW